MERRIVEKTGSLAPASHFLKLSQLSGVLMDMGYRVIPNKGIRGIDNSSERPGQLQATTWLLWRHFQELNFRRLGSIVEILNYSTIKLGAFKRK